jgi:processive 1,2-diacylglycerol beta-glucosyltransferase
MTATASQYCDHVRFAAVAKPRVLILTAPIGEGHDLPARLLAQALEGRADVQVVDALAQMSQIAQKLVDSGSQLDTPAGRAQFEVSHWLIVRNPVGRRFGSWLSQAVGGGGLERLFARERPDIVVSTYPGTSDICGRLRNQGRLGATVVSAISDLSSLHWWAHPGVDLHLLTHPESEPEVRKIAGARTRIETVTGLYDDAFLVAHDPAAARAELGLPADGGVVVVSGGGWAIGDLPGAARDAAATPGVAQVVLLCGRRDDIRARLDAELADVPTITTWGFTTQMAELLAAADVLIHSTAGLTVLEAQLQGCAVISYGWGGGHIRANNKAFAAIGLADVVKRRAQLPAAIARALAAQPEPSWPRHARLRRAADAVLELA